MRFNFILIFTIFHCTNILAESTGEQVPKSILFSPEDMMPAPFTPSTPPSNPPVQPPSIPPITPPPAPPTSPPVSPPLTPPPPPPTLIPPTPPTQPPSLCESKVGIKILRDEDYGISSKFVNEIKDLAPSADSQCLNKQIDDAFAHCDSLGISRESTKPFEWSDTLLNPFDDCVAHYFLGNINRNGDTEDTLVSENSVHTKCSFASNAHPAGWYSSTFQKGQEEAEKGPEDGKCNRGIEFSPGYEGEFGPAGLIFGSEGFVFFDNQCNSTPPPSQDLEQCIIGNIYYNPSPISLMLGEQSEPIDFTLVRFPLDNKLCENCIFEWKASEHSPLLVYDPDRSGKILSASQLFGNWTFGGKQYSSSSGSSKLNSKWENGYEALGSLDTNFDGIISGDELKSIRLWLDKNQNGISEVGEVVDLDHFKIKDLYYKNPIKDLETGDYYLDRGFARMNLDRKIFGKSIDWFAVGSKSAAELLMKKRQLKSSDPLISTVSGSTEDTIKKEEQNKLKNHNLTGIWDWKSDGGELSGILIFNENKNIISGTSYAQTNLLDNPDLKQKKVIAVRKLTGSSNDGMYEFTVDTSSGIIRSNLYFSDQNEIMGKTRVFLDKKQKKSIFYRWSAYRRSTE